MGADREATVRSCYREAVQPVSRLSATIPRVASRRTTALRPGLFLSRADVVPSRAAEGVVRGCGWHGMHAVPTVALTIAHSVSRLPKPPPPRPGISAAARANPTDSSHRPPASQAAGRARTQDRLPDLPAVGRRSKQRIPADRPGIVTDSLARQGQRRGRSIAPGHEMAMLAFRQQWPPCPGFK